MTDREILQNASDRLLRAVEKNTGTSFDADEVRVLGRLLHAISAAAMGTVAGREACAVCGRAEHKMEAIDGYPKHPYQQGVLVPLAPHEET